MEFSTRGCLLLKIFIFSFLISVSCGNEPVGTNNEDPDIFPLNDISNDSADFIEQTHVSNILKRSSANVVNIARFDDSSAPGKKFSIYVDETMTRLMIQVNVERSNPVMIVTKPNGTPGPRPTLNTTTGSGTHYATLDTTITAADVGVWKILKMDMSAWSVTVQGESPLDFTYQFLEGTWIKVPVNGDPIQGKNYTTVISVQEYSKIQKINMVMIFITDKLTPANMMFPADKGSGKYEMPMTIISKEFMIGIEGTDTSGHHFRRLTELIKPVTLSLSVPSYAGVKLYEKASVDIAFSVVNKMSTDQDIDVRIQDTKKFAQAPVFISGTIKPGENFTGKFVIKGGQPGETTIVTITARQYLGHGKGFSLGPSEVRQFTVERNDTTTTSSTSTTTTSTTTSSTTTSSTKSTNTTGTTTTKSNPSSSISVSRSSASVISTIVSTPLTNQKSTASNNPSRAGTSGLPSVHSSLSQSSISVTGAALTTRTSAAPTASVPSGKSSIVSSLPPLSSPKPSSRAPVTSGSILVKAGSSAGGKTAAIPSTSNVQPGHMSPSGVNSKNIGKTTTAEPNDEGGDSFNKGEIFAAAIASGVAAGVLIGVAALVTMGLVFKSTLNGKNSVEPQKKSKRTLSEHNQLAWT